MSCVVVRRTATHSTYLKLCKGDKKRNKNQYNFNTTAYITLGRWKSIYNDSVF